MPNDPCACCQTAIATMQVRATWLCAACAMFHLPALREEPYAAMHRELALVHRLLAEIDARKRIERGEDGFDG